MTHWRENIQRQRNRRNPNATETTNINHRAQTHTNDDDQSSSDSDSESDSYIDSDGSHDDPIADLTADHSDPFYQIANLTGSLAAEEFENDTIETAADIVEETAASEVTPLSTSSQPQAVPRPPTAPPQRSRRRNSSITDISTTTTTTPNSNRKRPAQTTASSQQTAAVPLSAFDLELHNTPVSPPDPPNTISPPTCAPTVPSTSTRYRKSISKRRKLKRHTHDPTQP
jgi:hypothetical protein